MNWLDLLMSQTQNLESPRRYFYFAGLSALSAVAGRKIWLDRGGAYTLYPNIFVMLVGPSGIKKGLPVKVAEKLVKETKATKVIAGRSSIEAIIENLGHTEMDKAHNYVKTSSGFIVSGEFSQSILENPQALTILTDLYDSQWKDEHTNLLKSGKSVLKEVYLTMLGASNEPHLHAVIGQRDIMGGFIARTLMVSENKRGRKNALVRKQEHVINYPELLEHLQIIANLSGEFQYTPEGADFYENWYNDYEADNEDKTGTTNRIGDTILKVAMLLSLARGVDLMLSVEDLQTSIEICMSCMRNAQSVTMNSSGNAQTPIAKQTAVVLKALVDAEDNALPRQKILQKYWNVLDAFELTRVAESLKQAGAIEIVVLDSKITYVLKPEVIEYYRKAKEQGSERVM